jgi:hypothetical protein
VTAVRIEFHPDRAVSLMLFAAMEKRGLVTIDLETHDIQVTESGARYCAELRELNETLGEDPIDEEDPALLAAAVWQMAREESGTQEAAIEALLATTNEATWPTWVAKHGLPGR